MVSPLAVGRTNAGAASPAPTESAAPACRIAATKRATRAPPRNPVLVASPFQSAIVFRRPRIPLATPGKRAPNTKIPGSPRLCQCHYAGFEKRRARGRRSPVEHVEKLREALGIVAAMHP